MLEDWTRDERGKAEMSEQDKAFEDYWKDNGVTFDGPPVMELAFKEVAQLAFDAGRKLENEECTKLIDKVMTAYALDMGDHVAVNEDDWENIESLAVTLYIRQRQAKG